MSPALERRARGTLVRWLGVFFFLLLPAAAPLHAQAVSAGSLPQAQASYLLHFVTFTVWPGEAEGAPLPPRVIGVIGDDFGASALDELVARRPSDTMRALQVRRVRQTGDLQGCDVLLVGDGYDGEKWDTALLGLRDKPVLTVGSGRAFAQRRGVIGLYLAGDRLRFAVNVKRAEAAGLSLSSRMLGLADIVDE